MSGGRQKRQAMPSFAVHVATLPSAGLRIMLEPDEAERQALAREAGIDEITRFAAELHFRRWRKDGVSLKGHIDAVVVQPSVVSLEPVTSQMSEPFEATFLPDGSKLAKPRYSEEGEMLLDPEGADAPELFSGDTIDAWPVVMEFFQLALDPFPRLPGEAFGHSGPQQDAEAGKGSESGEADRTDSPFAVLKALKDRGGTKK